MLAWLVWFAYNVETFACVFDFLLNKYEVSCGIADSLKPLPSAQVCRACGILGYYSHKLKAGICSACKNGDNISTMKLPYACKLLFQVF